MDHFGVEKVSMQTLTEQIKPLVLEKLEFENWISYYFFQLLTGSACEDSNAILKLGISEKQFF